MQLWVLMTSDGKQVFTQQKEADYRPDWEVYICIYRFSTDNNADNLLSLI